MNLCYRNLAHRGPKPNANLREVVNGIFYILYSGCHWRSLPHDLPPWQTVSTYFRKWQRHGVWEEINHTLRRETRIQEARDPEPTAAVVDSQSVKTTAKSAPPALRFPQRKDGASRGKYMAMMAAKKSKGVSAISWLILKDYYA